MLQDHPRRCGENISTGSIIASFTGSPPQVRGKLVDAVNANHGDRITPAGAGKTLQLRADPVERQDHPRRCGENRPIQRFSRFHSGSPPQVRGKLNPKNMLFVCIRITPAGAGKTVRFTAARFVVGDHPRRCGENMMKQQHFILAQGSPPQVRGKHAALISGNLYTRITPAGAGKTMLEIIKFAINQDHPRRCGENKT